MNLSKLFNNNLVPHLCIIILSLVFFSACGSNTTTNPPPVSQSSDLTRTGKFIAFTSNFVDNYDIYLAQVNNDGTLATSGLVYPENPYNLTHAFNSNLDDKQPNWSPNGRILVYSRTLALNGPEEIYAFFFKADGGIDSSVSPNPKPLLDPGADWDENPQFSPDGRYLVWDRREDNQNPPGVDTSDFRDLMRGTLNYDTLGIILSVGAVTKLTSTVNGDEYDPKWSPRISVQRVAYTNRTSSSSNDYDVWIMDPFSPANNTNFFNPGRSCYPAWSPACDKIIFQADQGNSGYFKIVSLAYPTNNGTPTDLVQSSNQNLISPTRMPNADKFAYVRVDATTGNGTIFITSSTSGGNGVKLLPLTFDAKNNIYPAW